MRLTVAPGRPLRGALSLPGDKSMSHRAALLAALADGESLIDNFLVAGVTRAMLKALSGIGVDWELDGNRLRVSGRGPVGLAEPMGPLDCGNSGTTMRLLAGALAGAGVPAILDGSPGLRRRPMTRIVEPLRRMGVAIDSTPEGTAPLDLGPRATGTRLRGTDHALRVASAQVKSAILLAALEADGPTTVREPSRSRDHTERMLAAMGAGVDRNDAAGTVTLSPTGTPLAPLTTELPGDVSSAAFVLVAGAMVPGSEIVLRNVGMNPTRVGLVEVLQRMGADLRIANERVCSGEPVADLTVRGSRLRATKVSGETVVRMIDEFPAFAVAAAVADGTTEVCDAAELRRKESDRISVLCRELASVGVAVEERPDGFSVRGGSAGAGGLVRSHGDHRIAMALALSGLVSGEPVTVEDAEIITESFPEFVELLRSIGADVESR
jgi:3-phosphoshikimate 1-carboxyvinyltransferase